MALVPLGTALGCIIRGREGGLLNRCESPIEVAFASAFMMNESFEVQPAGPWWNVKRGEHSLRLVGQYEIKASLDPWGSVEPNRIIARPDFAFLDGEKLLLCVDLDGHAYHEHTREAVTSDRVRDRILLRCGVPLARFTGSELVRNARACAVEAYALALTLGGLGR